MRVQVDMSAEEREKIGPLDHRAVMASLLLHFTHTMYAFFQVQPPASFGTIEHAWRAYLRWALEHDDCITTHDQISTEDTMADSMKDPTRSSETLNSSDIREGEKYSSADNPNILVKADKIDRTKGIVHWNHVAGPLVEGQKQGEMTLNDFTRQFRTARAA